jgi:hypothetical protein
MKAPAIQRHASTVARFIEVYCRRKHRTAPGRLCAECRDLLAYARDRLANCPLNPKPKCKDCPVHCYKPSYRAKIKEVMKFSGMYFVRRGRLDWLIRYFRQTRKTGRRGRTPSRKGRNVTDPQEQTVDNQEGAAI